jgi:hypothetical protein
VIAGREAPILRQRVRIGSLVGAVEAISLKRKLLV